MNLFKSEKFSVQYFQNKEEWRKARTLGIGGSDASAFLGFGFKTLREIWRDKKGIEPAKDISNMPAVQYGVQAEDHLRELYKLKNLKQNVQYIPDCMLISNEYPWMRYSPDGLIEDPEKGRGILEIKTYRYRNRDAYERDWGADWIPEKQKVPMAYYCQVLHGLNVTGFDFVTFSAEIRFSNGTSKIIERTLMASEVQEDCRTLLETEMDLYQKYFEGDIEPPMILKL